MRMGDGVPVYEIWEDLSERFGVTETRARKAVLRSLDELKQLRPKRIGDVGENDAVDETLAGALWSRAQRYL